MINMTISWSSVQNEDFILFRVPFERAFLLCFCGHLCFGLSTTAPLKGDYQMLVVHFLQTWLQWSTFSSAFRRLVFICNNLLEDCLQVFNITWLLMVCITWSLLYFILYFNAVNIFLHSGVILFLQCFACLLPLKVIFLDIAINPCNFNLVWK